ncbi:MAG: translation initiation factor IF-2 [PVC group bacterium]|nr:translation initiation factor IF-2 [PVC group bacterium]
MGVRVYELAKEFSLSSKDLVKTLKGMHIPVKGHMSALDDETAEIVRHELLSENKKVEKQKEAKRKSKLKKLMVDFPLTVKNLSVKLQISTTELIKKLMKMKVMATVNTNLEEEVVNKVGMDYGFKIEQQPSEEEVLLAGHKEPENDSGNLVHRSPVVTFMGHVDHGKTSLLDVIRRSNVTVKESGGITQHIGAYEVQFKKGTITFLDTPGHEAFTAMRARGANITDIVILVVAADDGLMPQTIEAINHAKAAGVPIVVAINKIDLPGADPDNVKRQLAEKELTSEDWGGNTITVPVSAKDGTGIDKLLEMIILESELLELKANPEKPARGVIIESKLSKGSGPTVTVLVQNGTLRVGDLFVCGVTFGKVRAMIDDFGKRVQEAGPSVPVEVSGLSQVPQVGDGFFVVEDEKKARELSLQKNEVSRQQNLMPSQRMSLEQLFEKAQEGEVKELKVVIKADVQGSLEALGSSLEKLGTADIVVKIIHSQVGSINESDVMLAIASDAVIIGFHVSIENNAKEEADLKSVDVRLYKIIYEAINDVRLSMEGLLEPKIKETFIGRVKVLQIFKVSKVGKIAGGVVVKGKFMRSADLVRLYREDQCLYEGKLESLKRYKDDVKEVSEGVECGIALNNFTNILPEDIVECFHVEKIARKL